MIVLGGSAGAHVGYELAELVGAGYYDVEVFQFPDGELYVRVPVGVEGEDVVYVNSLAGRPNELLVEAILTIETLADLGARSVHAVLTYIPYARQDSRFKPGEAVSASIVGGVLRSLRVSSIYTFDLHLHRIQDPRQVFGESFRNLTAIRELARYVASTYGARSPVVVGPDEESEQWARIAAEELGGVGYTVMEKRRLSATEVVVEPRDVELVRGREVLLVDDIISTGGTVIEAVKALRRCGAGDIYVAVTHAVLAGRAYGRLVQLGLKGLVASDTVPSPISRVRVAPILARYFK